VRCFRLLWFWGRVGCNRGRLRLLGDHRGRGKRPDRRGSRVAARCDGVSSATAHDGWTDAPNASELGGGQLIPWWGPAEDSGGDGGGYALSALVQGFVLLFEDGAGGGIVWEGKGGEEGGDRDRGALFSSVRAVGCAADGHTALFRRGLHAGGGRGVPVGLVAGRGMGVVPVLLLDSDGERRLAGGIGVAGERVSVSLAGSGGETYASTGGRSWRWRFFVFGCWMGGSALLKGESLREEVLNACAKEGSEWGTDMARAKKKTEPVSVANSSAWNFPSANSVISPRPHSRRIAPSTLEASPATPISSPHSYWRFRYLGPTRGHLSFVGPLVIAPVLS